MEGLTLGVDRLHLQARQGELQEQGCPRSLRARGPNQPRQLVLWRIGTLVGFSLFVCVMTGGMPTMPSRSRIPRGGVLRTDRLGVAGCVDWPRACGRGQRIGVRGRSIKAGRKADRGRQPTVLPRQTARRPAARRTGSIRARRDTASPPFSGKAFRGIFGRLSGPGVGTARDAPDRTVIGRNLRLS